VEHTNGFSVLVSLSSLSAVHELNVPAHVKGKKKASVEPGFKKQYLMMFGIFIPVKGE